MVFRERVPGIYNSWRICQDQVSGYSNNSYTSYQTLQEAQEEYQSFLDNEAIALAAIHEAVPLAQLPPEAVPDDAMAIAQGAPQVHESRVKDFIIVFLIVVIVRIVWF